MLFAWRGSNLLDSMTDSLYAGETPAPSAITDAQDVIKQLKTCFLPETKVDEIVNTLEEVRVLSRANKLDEAKAKAGQARTATQKLLESQALQGTIL